jgi:SNF2 family DNA or RNA helicase
VYYSNTFSLEDRLQSEDRNHRIGQENAVLYVDLTSDLKVDRMLTDALYQKKSLASYIQTSLRVDDLL